MNKQERELKTILISLIIGITILVIALVCVGIDNKNLYQEGYNAGRNSKDYVEAKVYAVNASLHMYRDSNLTIHCDAYPYPLIKSDPNGCLGSDLECRKKQMGDLQ
jgi:hypothetical protein